MTVKANNTASTIQGGIQKNRLRLRLACCTNEPDVSWIDSHRNSVAYRIGSGETAENSRWKLDA